MKSFQNPNWTEANGDDMCIQLKNDTLKQNVNADTAIDKWSTYTYMNTSFSYIFTYLIIATKYIETERDRDRELDRDR